MGVELRPLGVKCNIQCHYCYQNPQRGAGNVEHAYDIEAMKAAVEAEGGPFALFGGEPLLVREDDLETLWRWGLSRFGQNAIQTNGTLLTEVHVRLFKDYRVNVGISIDGPGELNDARWHGTLERTREATARTEGAIARLCAEGISPSLVVTLHRGNAAPERLPRLGDWFRALDAMGVRSARLHLLESENEFIRARFALTTAENIAAMRSLAALERELRSLEFDVFSDMRRMLLGEDGSASCVWNACDPYTTQAVRGVEGRGERSNCGRTNKDGIDFGKADSAGFERYLALYETPQDAGGCRDCRFFLMCKGHCPGTAIDGDWRNRTEHCEVLMALFEDLERELSSQGKTPLSLAPSRKALESFLLGEWAKGRAAYMSQWRGGA